MKKITTFVLLIFYLFAFTTKPEVLLFKKTQEQQIYVSFDISQEDTVENLKVEYIMNDPTIISDHKEFLKEQKKFENKIKKLIPKQDKFQMFWGNQSIIFTFKGQASLQGIIQVLPILTLNDDKAQTLEDTLLENDFMKLESQEN